MNLPNIITISRLLLTPYIVWLILSESYFLGFIFFLLSGFSDALDGWFARKAHEVTHFGKWIDPIADFACILSVAAYLTLVDRFPGWFFTFYLVRYVAIAIPAIYLLNNSVSFLFIILSCESTFIKLIFKCPYFI